MKLLGNSLIGFEDAVPSGPIFQAWNPATGELLEPKFHSATIKDIERAAQQAHTAFGSYGKAGPATKAALLRRIASAVERNSEGIIECAHLETALPKARLLSELGRTSSQLRLFASVVEEGSWVSARIDRQDAQRKPLPKPDIRSMLHPIGPVVVFGASNFPLAFSVAGGDTASALAAGNPVIVKAHPAHPGTSELVGRAIRESIRDEGLDAGIFSLLFDSGNTAGTVLVQHPLIKAGAFTGSTAGGRTLMNLAANRPQPIPFYAEMGSTNPVFILPEAFRKRSQEIAAQLFGSFTLGGGQFCTKPGLVFAPDSIIYAGFLDELKSKVSASPQFTLLTSGILKAFERETGTRRDRNGVALIAEGGQRTTNPSFSTCATVFETDVAVLDADAALATENFGPSTVIVQFRTKREILAAAESLDGQLTATIHATEEDLQDYSELIDILRNKVGRIVFNGFPTGVEVGHAMIHGGPYPACSDSRSTSVGSQAIGRFARPVCYQDFPNQALPEELKNENPLRIWRMIDGEASRGSLESPTLQ
jgi:2,5-dioxopentanoate dehydrogenase